MKQRMRQRIEGGAKRYSATFLVIGMIVAPGYGAEDLTARVRTHTEHLASDELEGRGIGSPGSQAAARYIATHFQTAGLEAPYADSYLQGFPVPDTQLHENNVVGIVRASQPTDRSIVVTAHFDAYGVGEANETGDSIYNGAVDNAVGVAVLIELGRLFARAPAPPQNLVFVATAAEEAGTHGSHHYVEHPVFPLDGLTVVLNIDGFSVLGPRSDYFVMPRQGVDFIDEIEAVAKKKDWIYRPPEWVDGMNTNFDTARFLSRGVPAFTLWTGNRLESGDEAARVQLGRIHTPDDEINEHWDWSGVEKHLDLYRALIEEFLPYEDREGIGVTTPDLFAFE